jgi:hypothetical protein
MDMVVRTRQRQLRVSFLVGTRVVKNLCSFPSMILDLVEELFCYNWVVQDGYLKEATHILGQFSSVE